MNQVFSAFSMTFAVMACLSMFSSDFVFPDYLRSCDYFTGTYAAGKMFFDKGITDVYPSGSQSTPPKNTINKDASKTQPNAKPAKTKAFFYPPITNILLAPLSLLPPALSLLVWQLASLLALMICVQIYTPQTPGKVEDPWQSSILSMCALTFLPVLLSIWIGQLDVVFGILPLAIGYQMCGEREWTKAGLVFSLTALVPLYMVPALFFSIVMLFDKKPKILLSLLGGWISLMLLQMAYFGAQSLKDWFYGLSLMDILSSHSMDDITGWTACNLSPYILSCLPNVNATALRPFIYGFTGFCAFAGLVTAIGIARARLSIEIKSALAMILGISIAPLVLPHFFLHNYAAFLLVALLIISTKWSVDTVWELNPIIRFFWLALNFYVYLSLFDQDVAIPLVLLLFILILYGRLLVVCQLIRVHGAKLVTTPQR